MQRVIAEWLENELDRWYYNAMKFRVSTVANFIDIVISLGPVHGLVAFHQTVGHVVLNRDHALCSNASAMRSMDESKIFCKQIQYCDPNLFQLIEAGIREMYNLTSVDS